METVTWLTDLERLAREAQARHVKTGTGSQYHQDLMRYECTPARILALIEVAKESIEVAKESVAYEFGNGRALDDALRALEETP